MLVVLLPPVASIVIKPSPLLVLSKELLFVSAASFAATPAHLPSTIPFPHDILATAMFNTLLVEPLTYVLTILATATGNYGWAIILITLIIRGLLVPLTLPSMRMAHKLRQLQPEIDQLKRKFAHDKAAFQQAQLQLFQQHNLNPASGCLPNILQFIVLIALYQAFNHVATFGQTSNLTQFFWLDITKPDPLFILPVSAALTQLILGLMLLPAADPSATQAAAINTPSKQDDKQAEDIASMAQSMQQQMVFIMPAMTFFLALKFPAGLALYWVVTTLFSLAQQYSVSGWGGMPLAFQKLTRIFYGRSKS